MKTEILKYAIIEKYGSITDCAKALNMSQPSLSNHLKNPSIKFIVKLKNAGVNVPDITDIIISNDLIAKVKEPIQPYSSKNIEEELKKCWEENDKLKKEISKLKRGKR